MSGTRAASFSLLGSKKWIIRDGRNGISRSGVGAPTASGAKKSFGLRIDPDATTGPRRRTTPRGDERGAALVEFAIVLPVLSMLLLGILTGGITLNRKLAITNGVREASRYGATLPVASVSPCTDTVAPQQLRCWLRAVATIAQQGSEGQLSSTVPSLRICVAFVFPAGTAAAAQRTYRLVRTSNGSTATDTFTDGGTCFADNRPSTTEKRVQVAGQREGKLEFVAFTQKPTLASNAVTRYEQQT